VVVAGRVLVRDRNVFSLDVDQIMTEVRKIADQIKKSR
jgi:hypothetical protein